jgi:hypothetical protein
MAVVVSLAGVAVAAIGLVGIAAPARLVALLATWRVLTGLPITLALRIAFGFLFIVASPDCRLPVLVRLVGLLELAGAAFLFALGSERLQLFVEWWLSRTPLFIRYWCAVALAFGILIAYAGA